LGGHNRRASCAIACRGLWGCLQRAHIGAAWHSAWLTPPGTIHGLLAELERNLKYLLIPERRRRTAPREVKRKMSSYPKKQRRHHPN